MTPSLGDVFPTSCKESFSKRKLRPGAVLRFHVELTNPPKVKIFVVLGLDKKKIDVAFVFINSKPAPNPALKKLQLHLPVKKCPFLNHDSYLDCSQLYELSLQNVKSKLTHSFDAYLGELDERILKDAYMAVVSAKTVEKQLKKKYKIQ